MLPPAARPWECGSPTRVTPRSHWGPGVADRFGRRAVERWGHCRWAGVVGSEGGVGGFRGSRSKAKETEGAVRRAGRAWVSGSLCPWSQLREKCPA